MIVDGRAIARDIAHATRTELSGRTVRVTAISVAPGRATESYLATKVRRAREAGISLEVVRLPETATVEEITHLIVTDTADALLVQLPLPRHIDTKRVLNAIPLEKDADVLSLRAHQMYAIDSSALLPPVVGAIAEICSRSGVDPKGKLAAVIGEGWLVGEPAATWLSKKGANVHVITRDSGDFNVVKEADIVVLGAGDSSFIKPEDVKQGVVLIDAGTSESGGAIVGDADPACAEIASVFTPVPGGVGPIAVACLFKNAATLALRNAGKAL